MTTQIARPHVTVSVDGETSTYPTGGAVQLDALRVPYAFATIILPLTPETMLDDLDPRDDHRVIINGGNTGHWEGTPDPTGGYGHGAYGHAPYGHY